MQDLSTQSSSTNSQKISFKLVQNKYIEKGIDIYRWILIFCLIEIHSELNYPLYLAMSLFKTVHSSQIKFSRNLPFAHVFKCSW